MTNTNAIPHWFFQLMYDQCGGFVECSPDLEKIWSECREYFVAKLPGAGGVNPTTDKSIRDWSDGWAAYREEAIEALKAADGSVKDDMS